MTFGSDVRNVTHPHGCAINKNYCTTNQWLVKWHQIDTCGANDACNAPSIPSSTSNAIVTMNWSNLSVVDGLSAFGISFPIDLCLCDIYGGDDSSHCKLGCTQQVQHAPLCRLELWLGQGDKEGKFGGEYWASDAARADVAHRFNTMYMGTNVSKNRQKPSLSSELILHHLCSGNDTVTASERMSGQILGRIPSIPHFCTVPVEWKFMIWFCSSSYANNPKLMSQMYNEIPLRIINTSDYFPMNRVFNWKLRTLTKPFTDYEQKKE